MRASRLVLLASCAAVVCTFLPVTPSRAGIEVTIEPQAPVAGDEVQLIATAYFTAYRGTDCFWRQAVECQPVAADTFAMAVDNYVIICNQYGGCSGDCFRYEDVTAEVGRCNLGTLTPGHYVVKVTATEGVYYGPQFPFPTGYVTQSFDVVAPTPVLPGTWGRLKRLYR
jgi:hypothetical protein